VADLPQQVVAQPPFAGRADEQIGVGQVGRVQMPRDGVLVDVTWVNLARRRLGGQRSAGVNDLVAAAQQCAGAPGLPLLLIWGVRPRRRCLGALDRRSAGLDALLYWKMSR